MLVVMLLILAAYVSLAAYFLYALDNGLDLSSEEEIKKALTYANITGGLTTQKVGAIDSAPSIGEIERFYIEHK